MWRAPVKNNICIYCSQYTSFLGPWKIAQVIPMTKEKSPGQHHGIFIVRDLTTEQILKVCNCHGEFQQILWIQDPHYPIETTDTTRIKLVINKQGLMKGTIDSTCQTTIINLINHLLQFILQDLSAMLIHLANIQSRSLDSMVANQKINKISTMSWPGPTRTKQMVLCLLQ